MAPQRPPLPWGGHPGAEVDRTMDPDISAFIPTAERSRRWLEETSIEQFLKHRAGCVDRLKQLAAELAHVRQVWRAAQADPSRFGDWPATARRYRSDIGRHHTGVRIQRGFVRGWDATIAAKIAASAAPIQQAAE